MINKYPDECMTTCAWSGGRLTAAEACTKQAKKTHLKRAVFFGHAPAYGSVRDTQPSTTVATQALVFSVGVRSSRSCQEENVRHIFFKNLYFCNMYKLNFWKKTMMFK